MIAMKYSSVRFVLPLLLLAALLPSCTPPATVPMATVDFSGSREPGHKTLLVFLPGIRDDAAVFIREGFIAAALAHRVPADMMGADAHIGYYRERSFLCRLRQDVILPAKKRGYRDIWLVGISLGGFGAIWYDLEHPGELAGIVTLSPYLGEDEMVNEVALSGGLKPWQFPPGVKNDPQHEIWSNLKRYERNELTQGRVFLGFGKNDKFAHADGMLAAVLPPAQVFTSEGGHDWATWRFLWNRILLRLPLPNSNREKRQAPPEQGE
jgi:pimeloyl-ACP methyl ester carboxylesterase